LTPSPLPSATAVPFILEQMGLGIMFSRSLCSGRVLIQQKRLLLIPHVLQ